MNFIFYYFNNINGDIMKIRLGYVAISNTLKITSSSTVTYTQYKKLGVKKEPLKTRCPRKYYHRAYIGCQVGEWAAIATPIIDIFAAKSGIGFHGRH